MTTKILHLDPKKGKFLVAQPVLTVCCEGEKPRKFPLKKTETVIGSSPDCDIVLRDEYVSGRHCSIIQTGEELILTDFQSTNGTFIGGRKISETILQGVEKITAGKTTLQLSSEEAEEKIRPLPEDHFCGMVGRSEEMRSLFAKIQRVAPTQHTILIQGETGSGKELVARALHDLSKRSQKPYVILNCGAISPNLIESELFGHEKGAFTGAVGRRLGAFEQAGGGTLFLDEIGELPLELQPKLLRVLENHTLRRVGGDAEIPVDVRVIAATHRNLADEVKKGKFREDLYFRLYVIPLQVPPLSERKEDIPLLAAHFLKNGTSEPKSFAAKAVDKLKNHPWPGNVRELKNVILRSLIFAEGEMIGVDAIELMASGGEPEEPVNLIQMEKEKIEEALQKTGRNKTKAADLLGIAKSTLFKKLKEYGIPF
ncbi:MAG: sigma 54-interacting transcriptional regulator [Deltaproteobacteria bacterium]|nr:sigma 54-interacting transcriptional regulator [Deltaproteobacteria bacterium]